MLEVSFKKAVALGYDAVVIMGNPGNYVNYGFPSCKKYGISLEGHIFPTAMLVKELIPGAVQGKNWVYQESELFQYDDHDAEVFDRQFEKREKEYRVSQEEFYIYSHSRIF